MSTKNGSKAKPTDSRFPTPIEQGTGNDGPIRIWEMPEPGPRSWLVDGFIPEGAITILYGDGGTGKSYLSLYLAIQALTGNDFLSRTVAQQQAVLFIDAELDDTEFRRRAYPVARGIGLNNLPVGMYYWSPQDSLTEKDVLTTVGRWLTKREIGLVVIDSLTVAAGGTNVRDSEVITPLMLGLKELGVTVVAVDHIKHRQLDTKESDYKPFGSVFKFNLARSVIQVIKAEGGGLSLRQTKSNFGPLTESVRVAVRFEDDTITFESLAATDPRLKGLEKQIPRHEAVHLTLKRMGPSTPQDLADELGIDVKTVRNNLTKLRHQGQAEPLGDGRWCVPDSHSNSIGEPGLPQIEPSAAAGERTTHVVSRKLKRVPGWIVDLVGTQRGLRPE
jgi:hypothetical protein